MSNTGPSNFNKYNSEGYTSPKSMYKQGPPPQSIPPYYQPQYPPAYAPQYKEPVAVQPQMETPIKNNEPLYTVGKVLPNHNPTCDPSCEPCVDNSCGRTSDGFGSMIPYLHPLNYKEIPVVMKLRRNLTELIKKENARITLKDTHAGLIREELKEMAEKKRAAMEAINSENASGLHKEGFSKMNYVLVSLSMLRVVSDFPTTLGIKLLGVPKEDKKPHQANCVSFRTSYGEPIDFPVMGKESRSQTEAMKLYDAGSVESAFTERFPGWTPSNMREAITPVLKDRRRMLPKNHPVVQTLEESLRQHPGEFENAISGFNEETVLVDAVIVEDLMKEFEQMFNNTYKQFNLNDFGFEVVRYYNNNASQTTENLYENRDLFLDTTEFTQRKAAESSKEATLHTDYSIEIEFVLHIRSI